MYQYLVYRMKANGISNEAVCNLLGISDKAEFKAHKVVYDKNPITLWCLINTGVKSTNPQGIESQAPIKLKQSRRIDGTVSLLNAYTCMKNHEEEYLSLIH